MNDYKDIPPSVEALILKIVNNIQNVIVGKQQTIEYVVISLLCGGHVLIEDVPGVGKTSLVTALSRSIDCSFGRIQFTPDVLPSDITGFSMFNVKTNEFEYRPGVVMSQIILADEINRTSPKTQSSLLEAMEERQVTVDGITYELPEPFMVLATQNPIEYLGTFPLPEAQLDRFFMKVHIGYPKTEEEMAILARFHQDDPLKQLRAVTEPNEIRHAGEIIRETYMDPVVSRYLVDLIHKTRIHSDIALGVSPRGSIALYRAAQAWACYTGRNYCSPDDVKKMAVPVLSHRIKLSQDAKLRNIKADECIQEIVDSVAVPIPAKTSGKKRLFD